MIKKGTQWVKATYRSDSGYKTTRMMGSGQTNEEWSGPTETADYYRYSGGKGPNDDPTVDIAVGMIHRGGHGSTRYPPNAMLKPAEPGESQTWPPSPVEDWLPPASERTDVGQISLIKHHSQDASSTVNSLFSTKDARVQAMTGLGMAAVDTVNDFGRAPVPSSNLSKHSAKLVQNMQDRGAVSGKAVNNASNGLSYWDRPLERAKGWRDEDISPEKVEQGKRVMRSVARRPRTQPHEQGTLF